MGQLSQLVSLISDRLQADAEFANVTVLTERKGDIENEIARALATLTDQGGKAGACAIVMAPLANVSNPNLPGPYLDQVNILVHIEEAVTVNTSATGTGKPASDLAERALALLHHWIPEGFPRPLIADRAAIVARDPAAGDLAYGVRLTWAVGVSVSLATVATPVLTATNGNAAPCTLTLTCATTGAAAFYTADGTRPTPANGTLYTAPVNVAAACTVKAAAWFPGKLSSAIASLAIT